LLIVADNLHVVRPEISRALEALDPGPIQTLVRRCVQAGAQAIDLNCGPLTRRPEARMTFLVETVRAVTDLPLLLDTTNPAALAAGLAACGGRAIINGFSLEKAKLEGILPLARQYDAEIIGYLLHPDSRVPHAADELMALAVTLFEAYRARDLDPARLIIDPVIAPLAWPDGTRHNRAVLTLIRQLPELLGTPVRTMAGISNLASGAIPLARKIALEQAFLPMLAAAGLDLLLINVMHGPTLATARICTDLLREGIFTWGSA